MNTRQQDLFKAMAPVFADRLLSQTEGRKIGRAEHKRIVRDAVEIAKQLAAAIDKELAPKS